MPVSAPITDYFHDFVELLAEEGVLVADEVANLHRRLEDLKEQRLLAGALYQEGEDD